MMLGNEVQVSKCCSTVVVTKDCSLETNIAFGAKSFWTEARFLLNLLRNELTDERLKRFYGVAESSKIVVSTHVYLFL